MTRTPFIAGNWKMNKTVAEAERYIQALLPQVAAVDGVDIVVCPPFLALGALVDSARGSQVDKLHIADAPGGQRGQVEAEVALQAEGVEPGAAVELREAQRRDG